MNLRNIKFFNNSALKNLSLSEFGLWLLIPFASLTSHTWLPLPPTMVLLLGAVMCWAILSMTNDKLRITNDNFNNLAIQQIILVFGVFCLYLFVTQYFINAPARRYMGAVLAPLYLIFVLIFSKHASADFLKNLGQKFIRYSLAILSFEACCRYIYNAILVIQSINPYRDFYQFKFNGPMYYSSNLIALQLIVLLFFMLWWSHAYKQSLKKELIVVFVLLVLALSRASIPAFVGGMVYYYFFRHLNWKKSLMVLFSVGVIGALGILALKSILHDGSFQSKFLILYEALEYYKTASVKNILFGVGFFETEQLLTYYAHNYFLFFLMESGVFGLLFLCATLFYLIKITNGVAMIVLLPFIIQTAAEGTAFIPYFYVIMALIILKTQQQSAVQRI